MPLAETLQPEAGDDRHKEVEVAKLREMFAAPSAPEPMGLGDIALLEEIDRVLEVPTYNQSERGAGLVLRPTSMFGHAILDKEHIKWPQISRE